MQEEWTYFIQATIGGPIKIGYTSQDPRTRLSNLQTGSPVKLQIVGLVNGNHEAEYHNRFAKLRLHGEWFSAEPVLLDFIKVHASKNVSIVTARELILQGTASPILNLNEESVYNTIYDRVIINDNEGSTKALFDYLDWDEFYGTEDFFDFFESIDDFEDEDEWEELRTPCCEEIIQDIVWICDENPFIERIGLNKEGLLFGFHTGPCNSNARMNVLHSLSECAFLLDGFAAGFFLYALCWNGSGYDGINLLRLWYNDFATQVHGKIPDNSHVFDPKLLFA